VASFWGGLIRPARRWLTTTDGREKDLVVIAKTQTLSADALGPVIDAVLHDEVAGFARLELTAGKEHSCEGIR
jgi:hypothetical protein